MQAFPTQEELPKN